MKYSNNFNAPALLVTASLTALLLAACNKTPTATQTAAVTPATAAPATTAPAGTLPLDANAPAAPPAYAPPASALPSAPPVRVAPASSSRDRYRYVGQAEEFNKGFADSPPDYAVDYQGSRPWYWRSQAGAYRVVEPTPQGDRYYYYQPGASQPFLVRDSQYAYGYDNGQLAVVYDGYGKPLPDSAVQRQAELAGRYLFRARALYEVAQRERHQAAYESYWRSRQANLAQEQNAWSREQQRNADWQAWRQQNDAEAEWRREADARRAYDASIARSYPPLSPPHPPLGDRGPYPGAPAGYPVGAGFPPRPDQPYGDRARQQMESNHRAQQAAQADAAQAKAARVQAKQAQAEATHQETLAARARLKAQQAQAEAATRTAQQAESKARHAQGEAALQAKQAQQQRQQAEEAKRSAIQAQAKAKHAQGGGAGETAPAKHAHPQPTQTVKPGVAREHRPDQNGQPAP